MPHKTRSYYYHYLYCLSDFFTIFIITLLSFVCTIGIKDFYKFVSPVLIYSTSISLITVIVFFIFGVYKILTKNFAYFDALRLGIISFIIQTLGLIPIALIKQFPPLSTYILGWVLGAICIILLLPAARFLRIIITYYHIKKDKKDTIRTLVVGAGDCGQIIVNDSRANLKNRNNIVAFIDDDPDKIGSTFSGIPIKGPISKIASVIEYYNIEEVVIAISNLTEERLQEILSFLNDTNVRIKRMPLITEMEGPNDKHIMDVNLNDLISRSSFILTKDSDALSILNDNTILITGAGGTVGSEIARQICNVNPKRIILFDIYENSTFELQQELTAFLKDNNQINVEIISVIGATYNEYRMENVLATYKPDYIFHCASYKHVSLMQLSPEEALRSNLLGTKVIAKLALKYDIKKIVLVSTNKADKPEGVLGASKRLAEAVFLEYASKSKNTIYSVVRFGNVIGSNGSVVPVFNKQINGGGPITITDKRISRYFITTEEVASLIIFCNFISKGKEIFTFDMGEPVKIVRLAERMIRQAGLIPYKDIDIIEVGLRPGEVLHETININKDNKFKTVNKKIFISSDKINSFEKELNSVSRLFNESEIEFIKNVCYK